jgi:hypothetical protein
MYSHQELADKHFMHGFVDSNAVLVCHLYQESNPSLRYADGKTFVSIRTAFVNMRSLHHMLPTGEDQEEWRLLGCYAVWLL